MNSNPLKKRIEILEKQAEEIQKLAVKLIDLAPLKYYSIIDEYGFGSLPEDLSVLQQEVITKYNTWYNSVYPLINKYLHHQLDKFEKRYHTDTGGTFSYDITRILELNVDLPGDDKRRVIEKFREGFTFQKSQLLSLKNIIIEDISDQLGSLNQLEECLIQNIFDYLLKNPTVSHTKSRSISPQKKKVVKSRDNYKCQICEEIFSEGKLEVDHIFPYSLGGSNQITNLIALCKPCNSDKNNRLEYYKSDEGRQKLLLNIREFVKDVLLIHNFGDWLKKVGDARRKKIALIVEKENEFEDIEKKDYEDIYITTEKLKRPNTELIKTYLEFINDSEISSEDLYDRLRVIYLEVLRYANLKKINEDEKNLGVNIIQTICKNLLSQKEHYLINQFHEILYRLSIIDIFIEPLKSNCLSTLYQFYEDKSYFNYLIEILDNCGYLKNIEKVILRAIDDRNFDLLKKLVNINLSAYKSKGLTLVRSLQLKKKEMNKSEEPELSMLIKQIIKNIENIMYL